MSRNVTEELPGASTPVLSAAVLGVLLIACLLLRALALGGLYRLCRRGRRGEREEHAGNTSQHDRAKRHRRSPFA